MWKEQERDNIIIVQHLMYFNSVSAVYSDGRSNVTACIEIKI